MLTWKNFISNNKKKSRYFLHGVWQNALINPFMPLKMFSLTFSYKTIKIDLPAKMYLFKDCNGQPSRCA